MYSKPINRPTCAYNVILMAMGIKPMTWAVASIPQIWNRNQAQLPPSFGLRITKFLTQVLPSILGFFPF